MMKKFLRWFCELATQYVCIFWLVMGGLLLHHGIERTPLEPRTSNAYDASSAWTGLGVIAMGALSLVGIESMKRRTKEPSESPQAADAVARSEG